MSHLLTLQSIEPVTHDTHHLRFARPDGFDFTPGQAVDIALDRDGWRDEKRPFTMTSLPGEAHLDFVIKSYPDHDGVTEQIGQLMPGAQVTATDPWGAFENKGPGFIVAGGAGVTPFIAILKDHMRTHGSAEGFKLLFANKTARDVILRDTFVSMRGLETTFLVTDEDAPEDDGLHKGFLDRDTLAAELPEGCARAYVCGPPAMIEAVSDDLGALGVPGDAILTEDLD